jgi:hypothetical protein
MGTTLATPVFNALAPRTVIADHGADPGVSKVRPGGILVWTNRSPAFPNFALVFEDNEGRGPARPDDTLSGTGSVVIHVSERGKFRYTIHYSSGTTPAVDTVSQTFSVHSCVTC